MNPRQHQSPWITAKVFSKGGLTVRVEKLEGWKPRYRLRLGALNERDEFISSILMRLSGEGRGKVEIKRVHETLASLVVEAQDWVHNEAQYHEDQVMDQRITRELKQAYQGKPNVRMTGKTQRNREKRKPTAA